VGGGGSGGYGNQGGGGGGGEVLYSPDGIFQTPGSVKTITIGAGGAATTASANIPGNSGANSSFDGVVAHGGGGGGSAGPSGSDSAKAGLTGGSSGGGNRFSTVSTAPTRTSATGFTSLGNSGGKGAGKSTNAAAGPSECAPFGAGGGGGGAMSAGGNAIATCSDSSTAGSVSITVGAGGAGAYLLGRCLGGGGASLAATGAPDNAGNIIVNEASATPCRNPITNEIVDGTSSGGGSGASTGSGIANSGGGGSGAMFSANRPRGGNGVVLIAYDPSNPPVRPAISTQPQSSTISSMTQETLTVAASINDGGTLSYQWQSAPAGSEVYSDISGANSTTFVSSNLTADDTGRKYRVKVMNSKNSRTTINTSSVATITINRRSTALTLSYPDSNTATYRSGETLTAALTSSGDNIATANFSTATPSVCSINPATGIVTPLSSGQCAVSVSVSATDRYAAASKSLTISIRNPGQIVRWRSLPNLALNAGTIRLGTTSGYFLADGETSTGAGVITYSVNNCSSFSITAIGEITPLALGSCAIKATQAMTSTFQSGYSTETLTIIAAPPAAPFINSVSTSGGQSANSGSITVAITSGSENGASITQYVASASPISGPAIQETLTAGSGSRSLTVGGLTLGSPYTISVVAINSAGRSTAAMHSSSITPAGIPFGVSALAATPGDGTLAISYAAPASLNGGTWDKYQYFITPTGSLFSDTPTAISLLETTTAYTFTGLTNGDAYDVKVVALTSANGSASSVNTTLLNLIPAAAPSAPAITISQISTTSARVDWISTGNGGSPLLSFTVNVTKNGIMHGCYVNIATTSCTLTGLNALDILRATAVATNLIGSSSISAEAQLVFASAPLPPSAIVASSGDGYISISFSQPISGDSITGYEYTFDQITFNSLSTSISPVIITGLTNGTQYQLFLRAVGLAYGVGALSETITATPAIYVPPAPSPPSPSSSSSYTPPAVVIIETKTVSSESSTVIIETDTVLSQPEREVIVVETETVISPPLITETITVLTKVSIRMTTAFNINSYFVNASAYSELKAIVKRYSRSDVVAVIAIGYSSPSLVNPYPAQLGTWRAQAIIKSLRKLGMRSVFSARYGGLYFGKRLDARKVRITLTLRTYEVRTVSPQE
jgi:hypothetical protein